MYTPTEMERLANTHNCRILGFSTLKEHERQFEGECDAHSLTWKWAVAVTSNVYYGMLYILLYHGMRAHPRVTVTLCVRCRMSCFQMSGWVKGEARLLSKLGVCIVVYCFVLLQFVLFSNSHLQCWRCCIENEETVEFNNINRSANELSELNSLYIYIYIYIYTYMYVHMYVYICVYMFMYSERSTSSNSSASWFHCRLTLEMCWCQ